MGPVLNFFFHNKNELVRSNTIEKPKKKNFSGEVQYSPDT